MKFLKNDFNFFQNLVELNTMIHEFATAVQGQQESIDRIEDNIEKAHENVRSGVTHLGKVSYVILCRLTDHWCLCYCVYVCLFPSCFKGTHPCF